MKNMKTHRKLIFTHYLAVVVAFIGFTLLFSFESRSAVVAQGESLSITLIRYFDQDTISPLNPVGLAFSPVANEFLVLEAQPTTSSTSNIIKITPFEDREGSEIIAAAVADPINMVFDSKSGRMLLIDSVANDMIEIKAKSDGSFRSVPTLTRHDIQHFKLENPQGMTIDPDSGNLFIVDNLGPRLVRVEPGSGQGFR